jgi:hypothetical protein
VNENTEEKLIRVCVHMSRERERGNEVGFQQELLEQERRLQGGGEISLKGPGRRGLLESPRNSLTKLLRDRGRSGPISRVEKHIVTLNGPADHY